VAYVLTNSWALLLGMFLLMVGNGLQVTLLAVRGDIEGFSASTMSLVMSGYFLGFLLGSRSAPWLIKRVGHVRVFAALASFISAVFILYPTLADPYAWAILRILVGFCFSGVYVVAESWLNGIATNERRGQTLSAYLIVQMLGIIASQGLLVAADPSGFLLFVLISVLVSISFAPILLSVSASFVEKLTAWIFRCLRFGRRLCGHVWHGTGLRNRSGAVPWANLGVCLGDLYRRAFGAISDWLFVRPH